jgi:hypothetical protein
LPLNAQASAAAGMLHRKIGAQNSIARWNFQRAETVGQANQMAN